MAIVHLGSKRLQGTKADRKSDSLGSSADGTNTGITLSGLGNTAANDVSHFEESSGILNKIIGEKITSGNEIIGRTVTKLGFKLYRMDSGTFSSSDTLTFGVWDNATGDLKTSGSFGTVRIDSLAYNSASNVSHCEEVSLTHSGSGVTIAENDIIGIRIDIDNASAKRVEIAQHDTGSPYANGGRCIFDQGDDNPSFTAGKDIWFRVYQGKLGTGAYSFPSQSVKPSVIVNNNSVMSGATSEFTFGGWVYRTFGNNSTNYTMFDTHHTAGNQMQMLRNTSNVWKLNFGTGNDLSLSGADLIPQNEWTHFCVTRNSSSLYTVYINGVSKGTVTNSNSLNNGNALTFGLGKQTDYDGEYWEGKMDDWGLWSRVLTATEIGKLVNNNQSATKGFDSDDTAKNNIANGKLSFNMVRDNTSDGCHWDLAEDTPHSDNQTSSGVTSDEQWVLRAKMKFTAISGGGSSNGNYMWLGMSKNYNSFTSNDSIDTTIMCQFQMDDTSKYHTNDTNASSSLSSQLGSGDNSQTWTPATDGTYYYVDIRRTSSTAYSVSIYTGSDFSSGAVGTITGSCPSGLDDLRYIKMLNYYNSGTGRNFTGEIAWFKFYNGTNSPSSGTLTKEYNFTNGDAQLVSSLTDKSELKANYTMDTAKPISAPTSQITTVNTGQQITQGADQLRRIDLQDSNYLGEALGNTWTIRCVMDTQAISLPTDNNYQSRAFGMGLSSTEVSVTSNSDRINWGFRTWDSNGADEPDNIWGYSQKNNGHGYGMEQFTTNLVPSVAKYYVEINRLSDTSLTMTIRTDSHSGTIVRQQTFTGLPSDVTGLRYLQFYQYRESANNNTTVTLVCSDIEIWNSSTSASGTADATISCHDFGCNNDFSATSELDGYTNLPTNTIYEQTDDTPTYWWKQSDNTWALDGTTQNEPSLTSSTNWLQTSSGNKITLDTTAGEVDYIATRDGTWNALSYDLGSTVSNTEWVLRARINITSLSAGNQAWFVMGLSKLSSATDISWESSGVATDTCMLGIMYESSNKRFGTVGGYNRKVPNFMGYDTLGFTPSTDTYYYVELKRTSDANATFTMYSDSTFSTVAQTKSTTSNLAGASGLRYLHFSTPKDNASGGAFVVEVDQIQIQDGRSTWLE